MPKLSQLGKKSKRKWASLKINEALVKIEGTPLTKYYERAVFCTHILRQEGQKLSSTYCNARTCLTCSAIRTAKYIHHYGDQLMAFKEPVLLTLTKPTIWVAQSDTLRSEIELMLKIWRLMYKQSRKAKAKKLGIRLVGVRALECTQRPGDYYHLHFHMVLDGIANAEWLVEQWLLHFPEARKWAQDVRPVRDRDSLLEVFKYSTKFVGEERIPVTSEGGKKVFVKVRKREDSKRTDLVIWAMRSKQLIAAFGGLRKLEIEDVNDIVEGTTYQELEYSLERFWRWKGVDWWATDTGNKMTTFEPSDAMRKIFE